MNEAKRKNFRDKTCYIHRPRLLASLAAACRRSPPNISLYNKLNTPIRRFARRSLGFSSPTSRGGQGQEVQFPTPSQWVRWMNTEGAELHHHPRQGWELGEVGTEGEGGGWAKGGDTAEGRLEGRVMEGATIIGENERGAKRRDSKAISSHQDRVRSYFRTRRASSVIIAAILIPKPNPFRDSLR